MQKRKDTNTVGRSYTLPAFVVWDLGQQGVHPAVEKNHSVSQTCRCD